MNINPVFYNVASKPLYFYPVKNSYPAQAYSFMQDSFEVSFGEHPEVKSINLEQASTISGIHCPGCGIRMISQQDYDKLIKKAEHIATTKDFIKLLRSNEKSIPNNMRDILPTEDEFNEFKYKDFREYCTYKRNLAYDKKKLRIKLAKKAIINLINDYPEEKRNDIYNTLNEISPGNPYKDYKQKIDKVLTEIPRTYEQDRQVSKVVYKDVVTSTLYYNALCMGEIDDKSPSEIAKILISRIFSHSISQITKIENYDAYSDMPNNSVLICDNCNKTKSKYIFWRNPTYPKLKENITRYLGDLAVLMGSEKIEENQNYLVNFCKLTNLLSGKRIEFSPQEIEKIKLVKFLASRHEEFEPIEQTKVPVPCADCGSIMLPHAIRRNVEDDLSKCKTPYDYSLVIKKYNLYIGKYSKDLSEIFQSIIDNKPDISIEEFTSKFNEKLKEYTDMRIEKDISKYLNARKYYTTADDVSKEKLELFDTIARNVQEYVKSQKFSDYSFKNLAQNIAPDVNLGLIGVKAVHVLLNDLKTSCYMKGIADKPMNIEVADKDSVYTIVFNMFKTDVATVDHLIPKSKGGQDSKDNLIGLCKGCNTIKSNKNVLSWLNQKGDARYNIVKQLKVINDMAKSGQLKGYDSWAEDIADKIYELSDGKFVFYRALL